MKYHQRQIQGDTARKSSNAMTSLPLQSGSPATLKKHNVLRAFLHFGDVGYLFYETGFTFGWVQFKSADADTKANKLRQRYSLWFLDSFGLIWTPLDSFGLLWTPLDSFGLPSRK